MGLTSVPLFLSVIVPLPFVIATTVMRFWIRIHKRAWGNDDWTLTATIPFYAVSMVATLAMSFSGVGGIDAKLSEQQMINSLRWFYVFQEPWCFTLVAMKASIGFALIRIAARTRWIEIVIYTNILACLVAFGGTGMFLFFQCLPVQKNWYTDLAGECQDRVIQTSLSYIVAAVSIVTDWTFASLPIFLLWNVQMHPKVKLSVIFMLGLGVFASIAPIVRLKYLIGLNDQTRLLENLGTILPWASAEMNVGLIVTSLPACRPLLDSFVSSLTSSRGPSKDRSHKVGIPGTTTTDRYVELEEQGFGGLETTHTSIHGMPVGYSPNETDVDDGDDESQKAIMSQRKRADTFRVQVTREISVEHQQIYHGR